MRCERCDEVHREVEQKSWDEKEQKEQKLKIPIELKADQE